MADQELQAIRDTWDKDVGEGRDEAQARALADEYVSNHPEYFTELSSKSVHELVRAVEVFREAGMEDEQWRVEAWLLHNYEPQQIGGVAEPQVRIAGTE